MPLPCFAPAYGSGNTGRIFGARTICQHLNSLTAFIGVGQVYGFDEGTAHLLLHFSLDQALLRVNDQYKDNGSDHRDGELYLKYAQRGKTALIYFPQY